ncbi:glycosyltransferase [Zeaxanthinibacter sp. PT1]|uniref:glycosyltransferase n=1 Tax=Zeaxanthinibacter TaxID=561554 RepID=UPI00234BB52A|nr:glycosyltransferase [Zeaxanthinibacter sp. PT1]MDC6352774.1 glycosyltransferase [Zeaxanthinibacter sp. PT1]
MEKIKIFFFIPTLKAGGAERIISYVSQNLNKKKFNCKLIVLSSRNNSSYQVNELDVIWLNKSRVIFSIWSIEKLIRHNKPDVVVSSITHLNIAMGWISLLQPKTLFVGRQATISAAISQFYGKKKGNLIFNLVNRIGLNNLDYVICQSKDMAKDCNEMFNIDRKRLQIINNPITNQFRLNPELRTSKNDQITKFITVGRLVPIKGHSRILKLLAKCKFDFKYTIIGDGPELNNLYELCTALNLKESVEFLGTSNEVMKILHANDYFLQGSYSEGFPNALLESCAVGTPVIAFDCPGGTREIIESGVNGYLAYDEADFVSYLNKLDKFDPYAVSRSVFSKFSSEKIIAEYEHFFRRIVKLNKGE